MIDESKISILRCPTCTGDLSGEGSHLLCADCRSRFPVVEDIVIFLTKANLSDFLSEAWGSELQKEAASRYPGFTFASSADAEETLRKVYEEAAREGRASLVLMGNAPWQDPGLPEELRAALDKSADALADLSRAAYAERVLDWPTGPGGCLRHLVHRVRPGALVVALDVNFRTLARIKPYYDEKGFSERMLFVVSDARKMPFRDNVFQSATAEGGTVEIVRAEAGFRETFRVLDDGGWFAVSGEQYGEGSPSMRIAEQLSVDSLVTEDRLKAAMKAIGFRNLRYEVLYEGFDCDPEDLSDEERCPLPARGDWFQFIVASGQR